MVVGLFTDRRMLDHRVPSHHPERPERLDAILRQLQRAGYHHTCPAGLVREATPEELARVHSREYLEEVADLEARGGGMLDPDTWLRPGSGLAARLAAGAALEAVAFVMAGPQRRALCLVRPPGHHARPAAGMGFCIYGNVALAAEEALAHFELNRVLIVDFDVHHGNGTQEVFYHTSRAGFLSIHRYPFYPGTGAKGETGTGEGLGSTWNIPLPYGTQPAVYHAAFRAGLETLADRIRPELVLISAGFDAHAEDPVGDLGLDIEDFEVLTREIVAVAETHAAGRIVSVLEGGYNVPILAGCVQTHLHALGAEPRRN
ncbi:MAG TPA: histone deacetylase [Isosphaeraceae bacterium]|nr:histone deacetylase [Isosphaeraceae bacterium]